MDLLLEIVRRDDGQCEEILNGLARGWAALDPQSQKLEAVRERVRAVLGADVLDAVEKAKLKPEGARKLLRAIADEPLLGPALEAALASSDR